MNHMSVEPSNNLVRLGGNFIGEWGTKVKAQRDDNMPNQANKQLSQKGTQSFNRYLISTILVWVPLEANPELRIRR